MIYSSGGDILESFVESRFALARAGGRDCNAVKLSEELLYQRSVFRVGIVSVICVIVREIFVVIANESGSQPTLALTGCLCVIRMRLERMTVCLEGRCSIQLSYRTIFPCDSRPKRRRNRFATAKVSIYPQLPKRFFTLSCRGPCVFSRMW